MPGSAVFERRQSLAQKPQRRVPIRQIQHLAGQPLNLRPIHVPVDRRVLPGGAAQPGALRVENDQQHRRRASRPAALPSLQQRISARLAFEFGRRDLDGIRAVANEQANRLEAVLCVRLPGPGHPTGQKS